MTTHGLHSFAALARALRLPAALLAAFAAIAPAAADTAPILPAPTRVSEHVYAWLGPHGGPNPGNRGFRMNLAFVVGNDAVALIETGYGEAMVEEMLQHVARITPKPVKYAINSNSQPDRFLGNEALRRRGVVTLATAAEAKRMADMGAMFAAATESALQLAPGSLRAPGAPDRLVSQDTELDLGKVTLRLHPVAAAHTPGPLVVHVVEDNVVYAGDVLYGGRLPGIIDGGNVKSWMAVFDGLRRFGDATFVPGHGRPAKLAAFEFPTREYLATLHAHMKKMAEAGVDMSEAIARLDQSRFSKLANYEDLAKRNANVAYREAEADSFK